MTETIKLTKQKQRILLLIYKFRFVTKPLLAEILKIRHDSTYEALESLVKSELIVKVYEQSWRIDRRPAHYYLSKKGVTAVRKLLDVKEGAINSLYKDENASKDFISECLTTLACYIPLKQQFPDADIRSRTELNRFKIFPKHRPDLYIKTPEGNEAFIIIMPGKLPYFVNNRLDEYISHSEEEGWRGGTYPTIAFVLQDNSRKAGFLFKTNKKLEGMGMDESELTILATSLESLQSGKPNVWGNAFKPLKSIALF